VDEWRYRLHHALELADPATCSALLGLANSLMDRDLPAVARGPRGDSAMPLPPAARLYASGPPTLVPTPTSASPCRGSVD
jgi:hypothetical protein